MHEERERQDSRHGLYANTYMQLQLLGTQLFEVLQSKWFLPISQLIFLHVQQLQVPWEL